MCPGHRAAGQQQDHGVDQGQIPGVERNDAFRRPDAGIRIKGAVEKGPEECCEEHHLGGDEQDHAVAHAELDHGIVVPLEFGFADNIPPPEEHRGQDRQESGDQDIAAERELMHVHDPPDSGDEAGHGPNERPRARLYQMEGMLWMSAHYLSLQSGACRALLY